MLKETVGNEKSFFAVSFCLSESRKIECNESKALPEERRDYGYSFIYSFYIQKTASLCFSVHCDDDIPFHV